MKLKNVSGSQYSGYDLNGAPIFIGPGEVGEVTDKRGKMMLADFPGQFEEVGVVVKVKGSDESVKVAVDTGKKKGK